MPLACNIDETGRRVRARAGYVLLGLALVLAAVAGVYGPWWLWWCAAGAAAGGAFCLLEARRGWCGLRAMGIKTPI